MHLNSSTVYAYSSRQTKSTKSHAKLYFALEQSKKVLFAMNVSCPTGVNVTQLGLASLMMSGLMFCVFWKEDYLKDRGGPSLGQVGQFRNRRLSIGRGSHHPIYGNLSSLVRLSVGARVGNAQLIYEACDAGKIVNHPCVACRMDAV